VWNGVGTWGQTCWISGFTTVGPSDVLTKIEVTFGSALFATGNPALGTACNVGVWSDPNQDGNPTDGVLLHQQASTVSVVADGLQTFNLTSQIAVSGKFFVGAFMANAPTSTGGNPNGEFPASFDTGGAGNPNTWICGVGGTATAPNPLDPTNLAGMGLPPTNLATGVWLLRAEGSGAAPTTYCTPKVTSNSCSPSIGSTGASSATSGSGFIVNGTNFINNKNCLLFYGVTGQASSPFQGGTICVKAPIKRTGATNTFGNPPPNDCSGVPQIDMNAYALTAGALLALQVPGTVVNAQWWGRDPGFAAPNNTQLSDGLEWTVGP